MKISLLFNPLRGKRDIYLRSRTTSCSSRQCDRLLGVRNSKNYTLPWGYHCSSSPLFYNNIDIDFIYP